jgi:hypothetical protein
VHFHAIITLVVAGGEGTLILKCPSPSPVPSFDVCFPFHVNHNESSVTTTELMYFSYICIYDGCGQSSLVPTL